MGDLLQGSVAYFDSDLVETFGLFGAERGGGWLLGARISNAAVGSVFETANPGGVAGAPTWRGTARIAEISPYSRIVLEHESPWDGRTVLTFAPEGSGTRIRMTTTVTPEAIGWANQQFGVIEEDEDEDDAGDAGDIVVGLITDMSGQTGIFARSIINCARLAVQEVNADGGIAGRPLRLVQADDSTDITRARAAFTRLTARQGISTIIGAHTSHTLDALDPQIRASDALYLFAPVNEGGPRRDNLFRLGESSTDQLRYAIPELARLTGGRSWFLLGNDYSWPREIHRVAKRQLAAAGLRCAGERYVPMGESPEVESILYGIEASGAEVVLSSLVGFASIEFERAVSAAGLRNRFITLSALMDENTLDHLGSAADGIWSAMSYFADLSTTANSSFLDSYRHRWGGMTAPPSALSVSVYESVHLWARAAASVGTDDPRAVAAALTRADFRGPRGRFALEADGKSHFDIFLGQARHGVLSVAGALAP